MNKVYPHINFEIHTFHAPQMKLGGMNEQSFAEWEQNSAGVK